MAITFQRPPVTKATGNETPEELARIESVASGMYGVWRADKVDEAPEWSNATENARESFLSTARRFCLANPR